MRRYIARCRNSQRHSSYTIAISTLFILTTFLMYYQIISNYAEYQNKLFLNAYDDENDSIAECHINRAIDFDKDNAIYYSNLAVLKARQLNVCFDSIKIVCYNENPKGKQLLETLKGLYTKASELNPSDAGFIHNLGWIYFFQGDTINTLRMLNQAVEFDSSCALYHLSLGIVWETRNNLHRALNCYSDAIRLSPDILDSQFFKNFKSKHPILSDSLLNIVRTSLEQSVRQTNSPILKARLGKIYLADGRYTLAKQIFQDVTQQLPNLNRPWYYSGFISEIENDTISFKKEYQRSLFLDPNDYLPNIQMGNYYFNFEPKSALAYYKNALKSSCNLFSDHYYKSTRVYESKGIPNDIVPQSLLVYIKPVINYKLYCGRISEIYKSIDNHNMTKFYLKIKDGEVPLSAILNTNENLPKQQD